MESVAIIIRREFDQFLPRSCFLSFPFVFRLLFARVYLYVPILLHCRFFARSFVSIIRAYLLHPFFRCLIFSPRVLPARGTIYFTIFLAHFTIPHYMNPWSIFNRWSTHLSLPLLVHSDFHSPALIPFRRQQFWLRHSCDPVCGPQMFRVAKQVVLKISWKISVASRHV